MRKSLATPVLRVLRNLGEPCRGRDCFMNNVNVLKESVVGNPGRDLAMVGNELEGF